MTTWVDPASPSSAYDDSIGLELIKDGGFEIDSHDHLWEKFGPATIDGLMPHEGSRNLTLFGTRGFGPEMNGQARYVFDGVMGAKYRLGLWVNGDDSMNGSWEQIFQPGFSIDGIFFSLANLDPDTVAPGYVFYEYDFTIDHGSMFRIRLNTTQTGSGSGVFSGRWYVDDISLKMIQSPWVDDPSGAASWS